MIRQSYTAIVERDRLLQGEFVTEPYECGWATEAIFYVRKLESEGQVTGTHVRVQISPDGIRWCDEGTEMILTNAEMDFVKVKHFGNWLRLVGELPEKAMARVIVALALKE